MKKIILLLITTLFITSCGEEQELEKIPDIKQESYIEELENLVNNQDFDQAIPALKEMYDKNPNTIGNILNYMSSLLAKGSITRQEKEYSQKAIEVGNKALLEFSNNSELYRHIGYAYEIIEDYEKSFTNYDKAIELDPNNALAYSNRGHAYKLFGDYKKALEDFEKAYELNKTNDHILINLAGMYSLKGKDFNEKSIKLFDEVINISKNIRFKSEASYSIASIIMSKKDYLLTDDDFTKAIEYYKKSVTFDPKFELGYLGVSKVQYLNLIRKLQNDNYSIEETEKEIFEILKNNDIAISLNPNKAASYIQEGFILKDLGYKEESQDLFNKAIEVIPIDITLSKIEKKELLNYINKYK